MIDLDPQAIDESTVALLGRHALLLELIPAAVKSWRYHLRALSDCRPGRRTHHLVSMELARLALERYQAERRAIEAELKRRRCRVTLEELPDRGNQALNDAVREWIGT